MAELKKLAEYCDFKETVNDMLRDTLVCGVRHDRIQRALLTGVSLTFDTAFQKARSMEITEKNYSHIEKEGLEVIFGVKRSINKYIFGRSITIVTDHKPLLGLLEKTGCLIYGSR